MTCASVVPLQVPGVVNGRLNRGAKYTVLVSGWPQKAPLVTSPTSRGRKSE